MILRRFEHNTHKAKKNHFGKHFSLAVRQGIRINLNRKWTLFYVNHGVCAVHIYALLISIDSRWLAQMNVPMWWWTRRKVANIHSLMVKVVHWIISPLEKQIKPKPVKENEAGKEGDKHGRADEEAAKKMVHANRNYKYVNTLCHAVAVFFTPLFLSTLLLPMWKKCVREKKRRVRDVWKDEGKKVRILMRLPTSNNF